ncbi:MAG TPA: zinc-dependent metalloprotease [Thermosynechococcaceae cyanobacterium]
MKRISVVIAFLTGFLLVLLSADRPAHPLLAPGAGALPALNAPPPAFKDPFNQLRQILKLADEGSIEPMRPFDEVVKDLQRLDGMITLYRDPESGKVYAEILPEQLNVNYLATITMESGIGANGIYSGLPLADFVFNFRRVNKRVQFVVPNVYFRTQPNDPLQRSVKRGFTDSVLKALPIRSIHPDRKSLLLDLEPLLVSDLPGLIPFLNAVLGSSYTLDASKSSLGPAKAFPQNVELEATYGFNGGNPEELPAFVSTLPDNRTLSLRAHYSFSKLPEKNGYRPRLADDRVGYFITAFQDLSDTSPRTPFVRYINRWHLEKQDPKAPLSPPKQPIVFWIENTVPLEYRDAVRDGILMWNTAFEQAGFKDAIVAQQMPDKADWEPADVRYNVIRWMASFDSGFLGIGPSRTNPFTGQILDADILIDASFARYLKQRYQSLVQQNQAQQNQALSSLAKLTGNPALCSYGIDSHFLSQEQSKRSLNPKLALQLIGNYDLCFGMEATHQLAVGSMAISMLQNQPPSGEEVKRYVQEFLRTLIAHEVGHTLGLRHNFRASAMLSPDQLNQPEITRAKGLIGSVMDYAAVNLAPQGTKQGDYFTHRVGPYDEWAIAYGYTPTATPQADKRLVESIARRAPEPDLAYATDEDRFDRLDPKIAAFDLSADLLTYAPWQLDNARAMWQRLDQRYPIAGESFSDVRQLFDEIFDYYFQYSRLLTNYVGGQSFNRFQAGDAPGQLPFEPLPLEKQRQALSLLQKYVFDESMFRFSPEFLNKLAPSRWNHWGEDPVVSPLDYPIHDRVLLLQTIVLDNLLSSSRLARVRDAELKTQAGQALILPELFDTLQMAIWKEVVQPPDGKLQLSSLRRGLQRQHLDTLTRMVLRSTSTPGDARTVAWYELKQLATGLDRTLKRREKDMDTYTLAHLEESRDRIRKALNAQLQTQ